MERIQYVLAPIDMTDKCRAGLRAAIFFARRLKVQLELLHVDSRIMNDEAEVMLRVSYKAYEKKERKLEAAALQRMQEMVVVEGGDKLKPPPVFTVLGGDPAETIARHADEVEDCMIVMTKKSSSTVADLLLGSVTQKVVSNARAPVITIHCEMKDLDD